MTEIRIWLGSLHSYNCGNLHGEWIPLPVCEDELQRLYNLYTFDGQHDYFIATSEAPFDIGEYENPFKLNEFAEKFEELSDMDKEKVIYLLEEGEDYESALEQMDNVIIYDCESFSELAEQQVEDGYFGPIPSALEPYIDYDAIGRDIELSGMYDTTNSGRIVERIH